MRIRLIIKDEDYREAMINTIGRADKDVYIEVGGMDDCADIGDSTLIITDYPEKQCKFLSISDFQMRVIFLTTNPNDAIDIDNDSEYYRIFKYSSISSIFSDIEQIYYKWTGETNTSLGLVGRVYAVCTSDARESSEYAKALARQVLFRRGGSILIISLQYINEYANCDEINTAKFSRLMYYLDIDRDYPTEAFIYNDGYGISYMRLPKGLNPIAYLSVTDLEDLVRNFSHNNFDTVILDVGNCYSEANIRMINKVDNILWFDSESNGFKLNEVFVEKNIHEKARRIPLALKNLNLDLTIDDYVRDVYGIEEPKSDGQKKNNK